MVVGISDRRLHGVWLQVYPAEVCVEGSGIAFTWDCMECGCVYLILCGLSGGCRCVFSVEDVRGCSLQTDCGVIACVMVVCA